MTVRLRDSAGDLIDEDHVTSVGEMGQHNPFTAELWVVRNPGARMTVEALEFSARDGSVRSLARKSVEPAPPSTDISLVFPTRDCTEFSTFKRSVPRVAGVARLVVEALIQGPTGEERAARAMPPFPQGSAVRSVILRNGVLTVDLNERLQNVGGACQATAIRESLARSLTQLSSVRRVVITAGGSEALALQP